MSHFLSLLSPNTLLHIQHIQPCSLSLLYSETLFISLFSHKLLSSSSGYTASYCSCRCLEVSVRCLCLSVWLLFPLVRSVADQDASCYRTFPIT
ncbi:hypothetical protein GQ42DRAFT_166014 [Ramicandelaber brevisporus]|nr:hypothetical protein GQ42DRAFT_166014 [Ramicandelaber brevisporus]